MKEKALSTECGNIYYWVSDNCSEDRITLFFLHGLTASHKLFSKQIDYFDGHFNLLVWDTPAHGKSRPYKDFSYEKAAIAAKQILDENGISEAVFIGQSLGGFITQSVIKRYPEVVSAFVSIDSTPFGEKYYSSSDKWWLRQSPKVLGLNFVPGIKRADRDNAIDVYTGNEYMDVLADGKWEKIFAQKPSVFTDAEKAEWISKNKDVAVGSDAFFPFSDNVERAYKSGVSVIAQPGGSVRDDAVIESCDQHNIAMAFTGIRLFHH